MICAFNIRSCEPRAARHARATSHALVASMLTIASSCSTPLRPSGATIPRARQVLLLISDAKGGLRFVAVGRIRSML